MQYWANDSMLYMLGGYGWDSIVEEFTTYPTLTAINVAGIINAVETGDSLRPHIRQYVDTNLAVCGGDVSPFGHDFGLGDLVVSLSLEGLKPKKLSLNSQ